MSHELKPCPFCAAGATHIKENGKVWLGMRYSEPSSVSVIHWCPEIDGQPSRRIERVGRDEESAIAAWNLRAAPQWIGVDDRLPTNWGSYLVWDKSEGMRTAFFQLLDGGLDGRKAGLWYSEERRADSDQQEYGITHWMALPAAPKEPV